MRYECTGMQATDADSVDAAAAVFARRLARREFGAAGYCRTLRTTAYDSMGAFVTYDAFIGRAVKGEPGTTAGHNVQFTVYPKAER